MEQKLLDAQELNDMYIESNFELQSQLSEKEVEVERLLIVQNRDQDELTKLRDQEKTHNQRRTNLEHQIRKLTEEAAIQEEKAIALHETQRQQKDELSRLHTENEALRAAKIERDPAYNHKNEPHFNAASRKPIDRVERQVLATGAAEQLLYDLQSELQEVKQERDHLQHHFSKETPLMPMDLPQTYLHSKIEIYHKVIEHTEPLQSLMQYYQAYGMLNLLTSSLPLLKKGTTLKQNQFKDMWERADSQARDTLAFMWAIGDLKLSLGTIEIVTGSPPFYIRRYILRNMAFLARHRAIQARGHKLNQTLPNLRPYTHSQRIEIARLQHNNKATFQQAIEFLKKEDTTICFEAVRRHQWLLDHYPATTTQVNLSQLKDYVTQTLDEQQITLTKGQFGAINHGTILRMQPPDRPTTFKHEEFEA